MKIWGNIRMKRYIKSSNAAGNKYYAYPIKDIKRLIEDYLYWHEDLGEDTIVTEPIFYAFIANSDMTDIDVAFVFKDESAVAGLSQNSDDVRLLLDTTTDEDRDFDSLMDQFAAKGITILDDESGDLTHLGDSVLFSNKIEGLIEDIISMYDTEDPGEIYDYLVRDYGDKTIDDLYVSDQFSNMIIPVKKEHWRF